MESSNNTSLNGKKAAVLDRELDLVAPTTADATTIRIEPLKAAVVAPDVEVENKEEPTLAPEKESQPKRKQRRGLILAGLGVAAAAAGVFGYRWWQYASTHQQTDNAYVQGHVHQISSRINGTVADVLVDDNQQVKKGQLLLKLDPRDYQIQQQQTQASLEAARRQANAARSSINLAFGNAAANTTQAQGNVASAQAAIATAQAAAREAQAGIPAAQAAVAQAEANLQKAEADYNRYSTLYQQGAISRQQLDTARAAYQVAQAQRNSAQQSVAQAQAKLAQAQENVTKAQAQLAAAKGGLAQARTGGLQTEVNRSQYEAAQAQIAQAQANLNNAKLQLSYTNITAPTAGQVGRKTVEAGQRVQPGQPLMAIVDNNTWVVANFKETQLEEMQPGEPSGSQARCLPPPSLYGSC